MDLGSYVEIDGRPAVRFERVYPHPVERVWRAVSKPAELVGWFPSEVTLEPRVGGSVVFTGDPNLPATAGRVLAYDPPRRLAFTWGYDELHLTVEPAGPGDARLILVNILADRSAAARNASGWLVCLDELARIIADQPGDGPHGPEATARWRPVYEAHLEAGLPAGASVPPAVPTS